MTKYVLEWGYPCFEDGTTCYFVIELNKLSEDAFCYTGEGIGNYHDFYKKDNEISEYMWQKLEENPDKSQIKQLKKEV